MSIVFEDTEVTFNEVECLTLKRFRKKPIKVNEYVYNLQGNPQFLTPQYEKLIIQSIKNINEGQYKDTTNKCSPPQVRISRNPINENKEYKTKKDMKKQVIRLTESDLHQIIKESVNKILKEDFQINLTNNNKEGWNNVNKWRAAANELQTKGSVIINIPLDYDNFLHANLMRTERGSIYLEAKGLRKEYTSISDAFKALQDYANNMMNN